MGFGEGGKLLVDVWGWAYTIDWWAVILLGLFAMLGCAMWKAKAEPLALALLVLGIISIVTVLALRYETPMDFIIFWE